MLEAVLGQVRNAGARTVRLGERSGMGETRTVLKNRGAADVAARAGRRWWHSTPSPRRGGRRSPQTASTGNGVS
nr:hypothetical protein [Methanoculleus marisnigri]